MKNTTHTMIQTTRAAVGISSFLFLISCLVTDLNLGGVFSTSGYAVSKMALGALVIGLGFGLPSFVYAKENLSFPVQVLIQMVIGCTVMLITAFLVGWIPTDKGLLPALRVVAVEILTAFIIWGISYHRQKKLARRINRKLEQRQE